MYQIQIFYLLIFYKIYKNKMYELYKPVNILGFFIIFLLSLIDRDKLFKFSVLIFLFSLFFLFLVPLFGIEVKGSKRWIDFGFLYDAFLDHA